MRERERRQRQGRTKWVALAQAAALIFQRSRTLHVDIETIGAPRVAYDTPFVFIGNNRYAMAGPQIGSRALMDAGKLWVCAAPDAGRFALLGLALRALVGLVNEHDLPAFETERVRVRMRRAHVRVATDGEVGLMRTPLLYRSRPGALQVIVPSPT